MAVRVPASPILRASANTSCRPVVTILLALCVVTVMASCGASPPAQPAAVATVAPTATPAPTPAPSPLSVIPSCPLATSNPPSPSCTVPPSKLGAGVNAAIDRVLAERPELFDLNDVDGGPRILDLQAYMTAVVAALGQAGVCGRVDPEGEIGVKVENGFSEQWSIASRAGWNPPAGNWVRRKYVGACSPATF
jgi:hypothetical protein